MTSRLTVAAVGVMKCRMFYRVTFLFLGVLASCSGGTGTYGGGGAPAEPVKLPDGTTVPAVVCGDENVSNVSGTWDVVSSGGRSHQGTASITISPNSFEISSERTLLAFSRSGGRMSLQWTDRNSSSPIAVTHGETSVNTGLLPLSVGGAWTFTGDSAESCTASVAANTFNSTCDNVHGTPFGRLDGTVVGIRQKQHPSLFGELGGTWHLTGEGSASVDVIISGSTFTAVVNGENRGPLGGAGWVTIKVCNGAAAGKTSNGIELAATRR